jgi:hypothetical protein
METYKYFLCGVTLFAAFSTLFASRVGNGGFGVDCDGGWETLDYHEGKIRYGSKLGGLSLDGDTPFDIAKAVFQRLERVDPKRSASFLDQLAIYKANLQYLAANEPLPIADDIGDAVIRENCEKEQIAAAVLQSDPDENRFFIKKEKYDMMNLLQRAGLIVHEIVYYDALLRGHKFSEKSRYYVYLISSKIMESITKKAYSNRLRRALLDSYNHQFREGYTEDTWIVRYFSELDYETFSKDLKLNQTGIKVRKFCESLDGKSFEYSKESPGLELKYLDSSAIFKRLNLEARENSEATFFHYRNGPLVRCNGNECRDYQGNPLFPGIKSKGLRVVCLQNLSSIQH